MAFVIVSSIFYVLAFPSFNLSWLAWVALIPLVLTVTSQTPRNAFWSGWLAGTLAYCGLLYWLIITFRAAGQSIALGVLSLLALSAYLGLYWGGWCWLLSPSPFKGEGWGEGWFKIILPAAAWVALEYLRTYLFSGFPWTLLADSQVRHLPLIQIASITGVYGVSFLIVAFNVGLALAIRQRRIAPLLSALGLNAAALLFGFYALHRPIAGASHRPITVALLQGNIDQYQKWDQRYVEDIKERYAGLVEDASQEGPNLVVWPETSVPGYLLQEKPLFDWLLEVIRKSKTAHIIGSPLQKSENAYNAAFSLNSEGQIEGMYAKQHLVPFGEVVPWQSVLGRWIPVLNALGGFTAGPWPPVLLVGGLKVGINICYEAIFPNLVRQSVQQGAELIVNLTNDGWYMRTAAPWQHLAPNIYRAVENRRWLLRANNTGVSALIDPHGRLIASTPLFEPAILRGEIQPLTKRTPYTRVGDLFAWICLGLIAVREILRSPSRQSKR